MNREEAENALEGVVLFARACYEKARTDYNTSLRAKKRTSKNTAFSRMSMAMWQVNALEDELSSFYQWSTSFKDVETNSPVTNKEGNNGV